MEGYIPIEKLVGVHPNVYAHLLTEQRNLLLDKFKDLKNEGKVSNDEYREIIKKLSAMINQSLPHLLHLPRMGE